MALFDMFVQFSVKGTEAVKSALADLKSSTIELTKGMSSLADAYKSAFAVAATAIGGFVAAGIHASNMGDQLGLQFERLSLAIAGAFRPEIEAVIEKVRQLADWIANMSDETKENIAYWVKVGVAMAGIVIIAPKIIAALGGILTAVKMLAGAVAFLLGMTGAGGWARLATGIAMAAAAVGTGYALDYAGAFGGGAEGGPGKGPKKPESTVPSAWNYLGTGLGYGASGAALGAAGGGAAAGPPGALVVGILGGLAGIITGIVSVYKQRDAAQEADAARMKAYSEAMKDQSARGMAAKRVGGPEDLTSAYFRMNVAALNATAGVMPQRSIEQQQLDRLVQIDISTAKTAGREDPVPPTVP